MTNIVDSHYDSPLGGEAPHKGFQGFASVISDNFPARFKTSRNECVKALFIACFCPQPWAS